jgi:hypothetical protein
MPIHLPPDVPKRNQQLTPDIDIDIIACRRPLPVTDERIVFAVRWALRPELGFPKSGFRVLREHEDSRPPVPLGPYGGLLLPGTYNWYGLWQINADRLVHDAEERRPQALPGEGPVGPYFEDSDAMRRDLIGLLPLLTLASPLVDHTEKYGQLATVSNYLGAIHLDDSELARQFWPTGPAPSIADILRGAQPDATSGEIARLAAVIDFYERSTVSFLLAFAVRFEFAKLLGLGWDDRLPDGLIGETRIRYRVLVGDFNTKTDWLDGKAVCAPNPPLDLRVTPSIHRAVEHPLFGRYRSGTPDVWPPEGVDFPAFSPGARFPRVPAYISSLFWRSPNPPGPPRLLFHGSVLYQVERFPHDVGTDGRESPKLPPDAVFKILPGAERIPLPRKQRPQERESPAYLDAVSMPWPPLEGWYWYRVRGVDLLGVVSERFAEATVRIFDDLAPPPPRLGPVAPVPLEIADGVDQVEVPLEILWSSGEDFEGPDAVTFRITGRWLPHTNRPVVVSGVTDAPDALAHVQADVTLRDLLADGSPLIPRAVGRAFANGRLLTASGEFVILPDEPKGNATVRVRKSSGNRPPLGDAAIRLADQATDLALLRSVPRRATVALAAELVGLGPPLELRLRTLQGGSSPPEEPLDLYVHVLGHTFSATPVSHDSWRIEEPASPDPRAEVVAGLRSLGPTGADELLWKSPVLAYPRHRETLRIPVPGGFWAGALELRVAAVDGSSQEGNVGVPVIFRLAVRRLTAPAAPVAHPRGIQWARPGARFAEAATYTLTWNPIAGAARYEVERVLAAHFSHAPRALTDADLVRLASARGDLFERRSNHVFGPRFEDHLPGRSPTRALYRVRAVSLADVPGQWSRPIGPVRVPDVRIPPAPNLLRVTSPRGRESADRRLRLEWTQAGPLDDLGFVIEVHDEPDGSEWRLAAEYLPGMLVPENDARFSADLLDQVPGKPLRLHVVGVRHALDPIDPWGVLRTRIRGLESNGVVAVAAGDLRAPVDFKARVLSGGQIALSWRNQDEYRWIEVRRRAPGTYGFTRMRCDGHRESYIDVLQSNAMGTWTYELGVIGYGRHIRVPGVEVILGEVPTHG